MAYPYVEIHSTLINIAYKIKIQVRYYWIIGHDYSSNYHWIIVIMIEFIKMSIMNSDLTSNLSDPF